MVYSQFKITDLRRTFGIQDHKQRLFAGVVPVAPSAWLQHSLGFQERLPLNSEKAKSEWIIAPILAEIWEQSGYVFTIHSGVNLEADVDRGLNGECDFILSADPEKSYFLKSPVFTLVESKRDDFLGGVPQCAAQMLGARKFNELDGISIPCIYGCVTDGTEWLFLKLEGNSFYMDDMTYFSKDLPLLLGVLKAIITSALASLPRQ